MTAVLEVLATGPRCLVQDLGRPGLAHLGVGRSGAADPAALRQANAVVGNSRGCAVLEVLLGGLHVRALAPVALGLAGAGADAGVPRGMWLGPGDELLLPVPGSGLLTCVAVRGGVRVRPVLGSRATDLLGGIGPPPVAVGDRLTAGDDTGPAEPWPPDAGVPDGPVSVRLLPGPRPEWFPGDALAALRSGARTVAADSDRTAVRLTGSRVARRPGELPPEGLVAGAVQVPPSGQPVVLLADVPVTGGYPVAAVVHPDDLRLLAQARPGTPVLLR